ncbi:helix-turn-helix domain-containing protein [Streptomyces sp. NPDC051569]|uniref:helix-turn-helix domain-containing protein n=1 Tax=Streptomyces sp. NPDC051569 TaxID=3365661 RepID=UPI0037A041B2
MTHVRHRHASRFTVVGNHLAQHRSLSLTAIGLAVHIQSLADGAKVGIKALAAKFIEGETAIASALRELETYGYLCRQREHTSAGRWVTRTISFDMPQSLAVQSKAEPPPRKLQLVPVPAPKPTTGRAAVAPKPGPAPMTPRKPADARTDTRTDTRTTSTASSAVAAVAARDPGHPVDLAAHRPGADLLAGLRRVDPRLVLAERDVARLAPAVSVWLERGIEPAAVQRTLTAALPHGPIRHPAGLLAHRLAEFLPPPLPAAPTVTRPDPLQNCDRCDHAFRAPEPGCCPGCDLADTPPDSGLSPRAPVSAGA